MSLPVISVWSAQKSPRLTYVLNWLLTEQLGLTYVHTTDAQEARNAGFVIAYGDALPDEISIPVAGLLYERDIHPVTIAGRAWNGLHTYFHEVDGTGTLPFDLFSGIFYGLSRYEEYGAFTGDKHGRYPAGKSILSKEGVLERPILDEWVAYFRQLLEARWSISLPRRPFSFRPTYDIDIAWSFLHKGYKRLLGAAFKDVAAGRFSSFSQRISVVAGNANDPYDAYSLMVQLHQQYQLKPHYFILAALQDSPFDKNIHPDTPAMQELIKLLAQDGPVGMHPSYFTHQSTEKLQLEKKKLEDITGAPITTSRQHYIRLFLPDTYQGLLAAGILADYSMGYATALGFRAGTSQSFFWYDLASEQETNLRVYPFCFMDTTAHFDLALDTETAFDRLRQMKERLVAVHGTLTTIFHNFSLGSDADWNGWPAAYEQLISSLPDAKD